MTTPAEAASSRLSVLMLSPGELFGGAETMVLGLCSRLRDTGVAVLPVLFHDRELAFRLREAGLEPIILRTPHRYDPAAGHALARLVEKHNIRVVHVHGYRATVTASVAGSLLVARVVKTEHGLPEHGEHLLGKAKSRLNHALDTWATKRVRARVCYVTADIMRRYDRAHAGLDRRVIHNGIEPLEREGRPRPDALEPGFFHAGIVGRLSHVKGIPFALQAMASGVVPSNVRLNIIGSGPLEDELRKQASSLGLGDRVRFHGFQRNVLDWLAHLDVLLMPSLHEGLPYTLLEAMSLGVPVVASRVGGLAEVLRDGETGVLVEVGDVDGLAGGLGRIADAPKIGRRLCTAAACQQRGHYALATMTDGYLAVYAHFAGRGGCQSMSLANMSAGQAPRRQQRRGSAGGRNDPQVVQELKAPGGQAH